MLVAVVVGLYLWSESIMNNEITLAVGKDPAAQMHLGTVRECKLKFRESEADPRPEYFHYACKGTKGEAVAEVHTESTGPNRSEEIVSGELVLANGEHVPLQGQQTEPTP